MSEWQDISTAPTVEFLHVVLIARDNGKRGVMPAFFDGENWRCLSLAGNLVFQDPTHWMPLPDPPTD